MLKLPEVDVSYWRESYKESTYPELTADMEFDVVIVGAGITGLTSAYLLKQSGFKVAVVEKDTVGGGTTGRTTGKVTSQHNLVYDDLQKRLGKEAARIYGQANQAAVERVDGIIRKEQLNCGWKREDNYVYTDSPEKVEQFKKEAQVAGDLGLPAIFVTDAPLPFEIQAAVKFSNQAKINSQEYLLGLASKVQGDGCYLFEKSPVTGIRDGDPGRVKTRKAAIAADHIIVATNVPTLPLMARGGYCILEYPVESYIIAGRLEKPLTGMYISPDKHHYSILPVGDDGNRTILIGGESHFSGARRNRDKKFQLLADYAEKHFGVTEITHRWSDRDYLAYDSIPLVGKMYPWSKNLYVATAFKKWGLSNGTVAAMILTDLISGKENEWAATFNSTRKEPIKSIPGVAIKYMTGNI